MQSASRPCSEFVALKDAIIDAGRIIVNSTDRSPANQNFHNARYALYALAAANHDADIVTRLAGDAEISAIRDMVFPISCEAGVFEECSIAEKMLQDPELDFAKLYQAYYGIVYETLMTDEIAYLDQLGYALSDRRIAYIGGGAMPLPAILMAQKIGCKITIVDPHAYSCSLARRLVDRLGLDHLIDVVTIGGQDFDYTGYDAAWIANWIGNKRPLFARMKCYSALEYIVARSATEASLSFIVNDTVQPCQLCTSNFQLVYKTPARTGLSLNSLIFKNQPCGKQNICQKG